MPIRRQHIALTLQRGLRTELARVEARLRASDNRIAVLEEILERELRIREGHQQHKTALLAEAVRRAAKLASTSRRAAVG